MLTIRAKRGAATPLAVFVGRACWVAAVLVGLLQELPAQSLTNGSLRVRVVDPAGQPLSGTEITVRDTRTGASRVFRVTSTGEFTIPLISTGEYEVSAEALGYQPQRVTGVAVDPGESAEVSLRLGLARLPVHQVQEVPFVRTAVEGSRAGVRLTFPAFVLERLPAERRDLSALFWNAEDGAGRLAAQGLPASATGILVDGVQMVGARHFQSPTRALRGTAIDLGAVAAAALLSNEVDVELSGYGGALLSADTKRGTRSVELDAFGTFGDARFGNNALGLTDPAYTSIAGSLSLSGPLVRDTAHFAISLRAQQLEQPMSPLWNVDPATSTRAITAAQNNFGLNLSSYARDRAVRTQLLSGLGRIDWQLGEAHHVDVRASVARVPRMFADPGNDLGNDASATDIWVAATATSQLANRLGHELRISGERSRHEGSTGLYWSPDALALPTTNIVEDALQFGPSFNLVDRFERSGIQASQAFHYQSGNHQLKLGSTVGLSTYDYTFDPSRTRETFFGSVTDFAQGTGVSVAAAGPLRVADFSVSQFGLFLQDTWRPSAQLQLTVGGRFEATGAPSEDALANDRFTEVSGVTGTGLPDDRKIFSPRFALRWTSGERASSVLQLAGGLFHEPHDPMILASALMLDGTTQIRRVVGSLGDWPSNPAAGGETGASLALLTPSFGAPRTLRASLGLSQELTSQVAVHLSGAVRRTTRLPRRNDLNLQPALGRDQYGRVLYGQLVKQGELLAAVPGSNRRFTGFDEVASWTANGASNYWDFTAALERRSAGRLRWFGSYTYSRTTDDWQEAGVLGATPIGQLVTSTLTSDEWLDARSDFDTPHRATVAAELKLPTPLGPRVTAFYRFRSGVAFTPGYRAGVDANADGSAHNDPAFIDDALTGMPQLRQQWDCLRTQVGRMAERNSCRSDPTHTIDVRASWHLFSVSGANTEVLVEGFNLLDAELGVPDRALVLVDGARALEQDASSGITRVPLVVNPNFGQLLFRTSSGRALRVGLRVNH